MKKPTGGPSCPPRVRRASGIARDILCRVNALSVRDESEEEETSGEESRVQTGEGGAVVLPSSGESDDGG